MTVRNSRRDRRFGQAGEHESEHAEQRVNEPRGSEEPRELHAQPRAQLVLDPETNEDSMVREDELEFARDPGQAPQQEAEGERLAHRKSTQVPSHEVSFRN